LFQPVRNVSGDRALVDNPSLGGVPDTNFGTFEKFRRTTLWGAPRIHGELLKLGFEIAQSSVAKFIVKRQGTPRLGWRTFLRNHAPDTAAMDLFVVPTIGFDQLYISPGDLARL
jgi:hypothetical protein